MPVREDVILSQIDQVKRYFGTDTEHGLELLTKKLVKTHLVFEEVQKRNEARGFVYGYDDKGRFVILKAPEGAVL